jgi:hypothetical protein
MQYGPHSVDQVATVEDLNYDEIGATRWYYPCHSDSLIAVSGTVDLIFSLMTSTKLLIGREKYRLF